MKVKVLFFASFKELLGESMLFLDLEDNASMQMLCDILATKGELWGTIFNQPSCSLKMACNQQLAELSTILVENDEVAFFPPVTGG